MVQIEPYYVLMELPDGPGLHFVQILPFTPANRDTIAWLAAYSDPEFYGKITYQFGKDTLYFGPKQAEARILTKTRQSVPSSAFEPTGQQCHSWELARYPHGEQSALCRASLSPQAATGQIPELRRVILATGERIVMAKNPGLALA